MSDAVYPDDLPDGVSPDGAVAMDFALGALDGFALRAAELRLRRDPAFAAEVAAWQAHLTPLAAAVPAVPPPVAAWRGIERELFRDLSGARAGPVAGGAGAALRLWRAWALGASAVAASALGLLATRPAAVGAPAAIAAAGNLLAASMASPTGKAVLITATYDPARGAVILTPAAQDASHGLTPELWVIVGHARPRSLGVIAMSGAQAHVIAPELRAQLARGATLAVSLEPAGGSPTGQPTGPVVAAGTLRAI